MLYVFATIAETLLQLVSCNHQTQISITYQKSEACYLLVPLPATCYISYFEKDTMAKAAYKREHLSGAFLTVLESGSLMITAGSMAAGEQARH